MTIPGPATVGAYVSPGTGLDAAVAVPAGVAANDIIVVTLHKENANTVTMPEGFALLDVVPLASPGFWHYVFWKRATAADTGTYLFEWAGDDWRTAIAIRIPGCVTTGSPFDVTTHAENAALSTTTPAVSLTTTGADRLLIWLADLWDTAAFTAPASYTRPTNTWPTNRLLDVATRGQAAAGATGSVTGTIGTSRQRIARLLALKPAASFVAPGSVFDIDDWKITLPSGPSSDATEVTQPTLETYADQYFNLDSSNRIVMTAPVQGSTTSGSDGTRCEFREMEGGSEANWAFATSGFRQLTVSGMFDPTSITDRKEMIVGQIHGTTGTPPVYLAVEHHVASPRLRLFKSGDSSVTVPGVDGLTATTEITYRMRIVGGRLKLWAAIGGVANLPAVPQFDWATSELIDVTGCYFKAGAYNKSTVANGGTGAAIATITRLELIQPGDPIPVDNPEPGRFLLAY